MHRAIKTLVGFAIILIIISSCASTKSHGKLDPKKKIPCPHKDC